MSKAFSSGKSQLPGTLSDFSRDAKSGPHLASLGGVWRAAPFLKNVTLPSGSTAGEFRGDIPKSGVSGDDVTS